MIFKLISLTRLFNIIRHEVIYFGLFCTLANRRISFLFSTTSRTLINYYYFLFRKILIRKFYEVTFEHMQNPGWNLIRAWSKILIKLESKFWPNSNQIFDSGFSRNVKLIYVECKFIYIINFVWRISSTTKNFQSWTYVQFIFSVCFV